MENKIEIYQLEKDDIVLKGNHKHHAPVHVTREADIFKELQELVKYFFPYAFEFNYSRKDFSDETNEGLRAFEEIYHFGIGKYNRRKTLFSRQLGLLEEKISEMKKSYVDKE